MCGQFTLDLDAYQLQLEFDLDSVADTYTAGGDFFPQQQIAVISNAEPHSLKRMRWGLIPFWAKDESISRHTFNARSETVQEKPSFRNAFRQKRCLIPATGFYEFTDSVLPGHRKQRIKLGMQGDRPFLMAGLWDQWDRGGKPILSCTIVTCAANDLVGQYHNRMPVILSKPDAKTWLEERTPPELSRLLVPFPADEMVSQPV